MFGLITVSPHMKHVKFLPWVGRNYAARFNGLRTLILGESHYQWEAGISIDDDRNCTIDRVEEQLEGCTGAFWTKTASAVLGKKPTLDEKKHFWNSVAFYNYVQESAGFGPRIRPSAQSWEVSKVPFMEVLESLRPELIIALGYRLWEMLPDLDGYEGPRIETAPQKRTWVYPYSEGRTLLYTIRHPSSGFNYISWHQHIIQAAGLAKELAGPEQK